MKGLTVDAQLFLFLRVNVVVGDTLFMRKEDWERIGRLKPEKRVNLAVGMSDVCVRVCADGVRDQNLGIMTAARTGRLDYNGKY
jgi:hypothetical protein